MAALRRSTRCCGHLPLLVYVFLWAFNTSRATDTLRQGESITVAQTLVSAGGVFKLGFFMPSGSTNRYVGIWYGGITPQTVVWVANRGKPIADDAGSLTVDSNGRLIILDGSGNPVVVVAQGLGKGTTCDARLWDSGNLVLRGRDFGGILWQSFDNPTDTWLPHMTLGRKGSQSLVLTSWTSSQNPSSGYFKFQADEDRMIISQKGNWLWNGKASDLINKVFIIVNYVFLNESDEAYFFYQPNLYGSHDSNYSLTRIVMEAEGQVRLWAWGRANWTLLQAQPANSKYASKGGRKRQLLIALPVVLVTSILGAFILCCFLRRKRDGKEEENGEELLLRDMGMDGAVTYKFVDVNVGGNDRGPEIYVYSFSNVLAATNNFSDDNKLGEGGFGPVYKGKLPDGQEIAIKRLSIRSGQGLEEFKTEILLVVRLQHKNLVKLLGCCIHGEERLLIYEYMPNKSLDYFLFVPKRAEQLDWGQRIQIIEGIAQGLLYLHKYSRVTIIHRDLKPSNILLDNEMNPKISDFGMARIFSSNQDQANTNRIVGTYGYMSPEYAMEGLFSIKSDVFSYGVMLLEIVSGRKSIGSHHHFPIPRSLLSYAWELWNVGRELELVDPSLKGSWPGQEVSRCIYVGLMCVQDRADDRPTMVEVVAMLTSESSAHGAPKQPAFITGRYMAQESSSANSAVGSSKNDVTITAIEGR